MGLGILRSKHTRTAGMCSDQAGLSSSPAEPTESSAPSGRFLLVASQNLWASPSECRALGGDSQEAVVSNTPRKSICSCESLAHPGPSLDKGEEGQSSHGSSW